MIYTCKTCGRRFDRRRLPSGDVPAYCCTEHEQQAVAQTSRPWPSRRERKAARQKARDAQAVEDLADQIDDVQATLKPPTP